MKFTKTAAAATVGLAALVAALSYGSSSVAVAQTPAVPSPPTPPAKAAVPAAPVVSNVPRHPGTYTGQKVDAMTYAPTCPAFSIGMDAAAIQESSSRAYVEGEARRFDAVRDRWDEYEDCLTENARRDIEVVRTNLGDVLSGAATAEAATFNGMNTAATSNIERISKLPAPKAPKAPRGAPVAAPAAPVAPTVSAWTVPTGRFVGTLTGTAAAPIYASGCPDALGGLTPAAFTSETTREGYTRLLDELRALPDRINQVRTCRQENGQRDYELLQKVVQDGVNAVFVPRKTAFEREYAAVRFQLNEHRKPGEIGRAHV